MPAQAAGKAFLLTDNWDDWFEFSTLYALVIFDEDGERHSIGEVKIGSSTWPMINGVQRSLKASMSLMSASSRSAKTIAITVT